MFFRTFLRYCGTFVGTDTDLSRAHLDNYHFSVYPWRGNAIGSSDTDPILSSDEIGFSVAVSILFSDMTGFTEIGADNYHTSVYSLERRTRFSMSTVLELLATWQAAGHAFDPS